MLAVEHESFPGNALTCEYFQDALGRFDASVFVAEDINECCVVGYPYVVLVSKYSIDAEYIYRL